jgi:hypothetical protein
MDIRVDESDKARTVTMDLSDRTIPSAIKAINEQTSPQKPIVINTSVPGPGKKILVIGVHPKKDQ